jgi:hypothetical protein
VDRHHHELVVEIPDDRRTEGSAGQRIFLGEIDLLMLVELRGHARIP